MDKSRHEQRVSELIELILRAATGDLSKFYEPSASQDDLDAIGVAFNSFLEEVREERENREKELLTWRRAMHDIRGPIGSISQLIETLRPASGSPQADSAFRAQAMNAVRESCGLMVEKINEALKHYKPGQNDLQKISIHETVAQVLKLLMLRMVEDDFEISVQVQEDFMLYSDPNLIQSIFKNLIENSWKYRRPNIKGKLIISARTEGDVSILAFKDNGIGIEKPHLQKVFQIFGRVSDKKDGVGYGLYSVKRDIETLGGEIHVSSVLDEGTEFELRLKNVTSFKVWDRLIPTG